MANMDNFDSIEKTLRFELKPIGKTLDYIKEIKLLERDELKSKNSKEVQKIIDKKLKCIIEERLALIKFDDKNLEKASSRDSKEKEAGLSYLRKQVIKIFNEKEFKENYLKAGKHINILKKENPQNSMIKEFDKFTTYFEKFFEIREYIFLKEESGSIAYRLVNENLKIYINNIEKIKKLPDELKKNLNEIEKIDKISLYNNFCTQETINTYNEILGGNYISDNEKVQGINEKINLYCQKNKKKLPRLDQLYKMILSDEKSKSFVLENIENDYEIIEMITSLFEEIVFDEEIKLFEGSNIFVSYNQIGNLPGVNYSIISNLIIKNYDEENSNLKRGKSYEENRKKNIESKIYPIEFLSRLLKDSDIDLIEKIKNRYIELLDKYKNSKKIFENENWSSIKNIKDEDKVHLIKEVLDSLKNIQRFFNIFEIVDEYENPNVEFYLWLSKNIKQLGSEFNSTYNRVRNYLTKNKYSNKKFKLNFDYPTFAKGWHINKESSNGAFIVRKFNNARKEYDYFLGVWNKSISEKQIKSDNQGSFEKMKYKQYQKPERMLPKQFLCKTWNEKYPVTQEFKLNYQEKKYTQGKNFDKQFLHQLIDRYKHGLINHEEKYQEVFGFKFKETKDYNSFSEFLNDIEKDNYSIYFEKIIDIDNLVEEGKIYLFQIWSKDFSIYSKGTKNLNTIYFESLFSKENIIKKIFKLLGGAEVFYRHSSIKYDKDKLKKGHHYEDLKDKFNYPIIKDRRYSEDKFLFHIPIKINLKNTDKNINKNINSSIEKFTHIIGIDRGERHLVYLSVIDIKTGKIIEQKHLDEIINIDCNGKTHKTSYLEKLEDKSKLRDNERKSWQKIKNIKELKEGYISQVVNEICNLQKKYNALIVMENLNYGFKRSRFKVEKQVYQKFETALIKKLNYIIDKKNPNTYLNGYQLTNKITTLDKIGSQSGIIFYIPAWNTSKIDPITGFVNLLNSNDLNYENQTKSKEFIEKIDKIYYENGEYKFHVDFSKWNNYASKSKTKWILTSYGSRIQNYKNVEKNNQWTSREINLTNEFDQILNKNGTLKNTDVKTYKRFMLLFKLMLQIRNSVIGTDIDYMISPVAYKSEIHFDSREVGKILPQGLPKDADANGAYNIARKGVMVVENIKNKIEKPTIISNEDYLIYIQENKILI